MSPLTVKSGTAISKSVDDFGFCGPAVIGRNSLSHIVRLEARYEFSGHNFKSPGGTSGWASLAFGRETNGRWLKGQSGNLAGRPQSSRQRISEQLLTDLAGVRETHGASVLERLAMTEPGKLAQIAHGLLPRDVFISVEQRTPGNLDPADWEILRRVVDLIKVNAPGGELSSTLEVIESALRADQAKLVDHE